MEMASEHVSTGGFVDRRSGCRTSRLDRKRRGVAEVAPTKAMMLDELAHRYRWVAYCVIAASLYLHNL
jgi:hypothetical protein